MLPPEVEPAERELVRLLERALSPSFILVKRLGAGGMGSVYLARDPVLKRLVAVKVMSPTLAADAAARARFEREAQAVASISHPNVVAVYSVGQLENGVPYLVMQYVAGRTMAETIAEQGPLDVRTAKRVLGEVASAIEAAHRKGIIHRDIKPANILWDDDTGRALVSDFGIAAVLEGAAESGAGDAKITHTGMIVGTPAFMSPEQFLAEPVTEKSDIYSLGVLGYELLIGEGPYPVSSPREMMAAHLRDNPRRLSSVRADVDPELERLLESCLSKDPKLRPTAEEVERRLAHGASVLLEWPPPGLEQLGATLRTSLGILLLGGIAAGIPIVALSVFERTSAIREALPPTLVLLAVTGIALVTFVAGVVGLGRFIREAAAAVSAGYRWGTVAEVASDVRGDTGTLIAGGREYAELTPRERSVMRRNRVIACGLRVAAGLAPILGYSLSVVIAARRDNGPLIVLWASLALTLVLLAAARAMRLLEDRRLRGARMRIRTASAASARSQALSQLAESWMAGFEQIRVGQSFGPGPGGRTKEVRRVAWSTLAVGVTAAVTIYALMTLTVVIGVAAVTGAYPRFDMTRAKIKQVSPLASYRLAPDSTISGLRAGQALHAILREGRSGPLHRWEKPPAITFAQAPQLPVGNVPFNASGQRWMQDAFVQARRGLSLEQRRFLRAYGANAALPEFRILARAPSLDFVLAYVNMSRDSAPPMGQMPVPLFAGLRKVADANTALAVLDLSEGRPDDAERRLREVLSVGFLMIDYGNLLIQNLVGASLVSSARSHLTVLYDATGRGREARLLSSDLDLEAPVSQPGRRGRVTENELHSELRRIILDTAEVKGIRWELLLNVFVWLPCADLHQVIFGADSAHRATLASARAAMVRTPSDSALFSYVESVSDHPTMAPGQGARIRAVRASQRFARGVSLLTGNRQLEGCLALFGGAY